MRAAAALAALTLAGAGACHPPARVYLRDGRVVRGHIEPGDAGHLMVGDTRVARAEVRRIVHPGRAAAIAGTVVGVVFGVGAIATLTSLDDQPDLARLTLGMSTTFFAVGAGTATWGWTVWSRSRAAARPLAPQGP